MIKLKVEIDGEEKYIGIGIFSFIKVMLITTLALYCIVFTIAFTIGFLLGILGIM